MGLGGSAYAAAFREETGIAFPLLIDETRAAYRAAGLRRGGLLELLRPFNVAARRRAKAAGHGQHRPGKDPLQLGGTFVLGPGSAERFAHRSATYGDVADLDAVIASLRNQPSR